MLVIKIELWPAGQESKSRQLGIGTIANIGGSSFEASYDVTLFRSAEYSSTAGVWKRGKVRKFLRKKYGPWDLLFLALCSALGEQRTVQLLEHSRSGR